MEQPLLEKIPSGLAEIRQTIAKAQKLVDLWEFQAPESDDEESVKYFVESAFIQTRVLFEFVGLMDALKAVSELQREAQTEYAKVDSWEDNLYLHWGNKLGQYLDALAAICGGEKIETVTRDVVEILKNTEYSITDRKCFPQPPQNEADVHTRIEAILKCVFFPLRHKPAIAKPIKNFEPDTGLPAVKTLIEYKYVTSDLDVKRVSDEILADTRGYTSKDWDRFVYVIYETGRFESEKKWNEHLRECGIADNTSAIVIRGELASKPKSARAKRGAKTGSNPEG